MGVLTHAGFHWFDVPRYAARAIVCLWALAWLVLGVISGLGQTSQLVDLAPHALPGVACCLVAWLAWRWERAGAAVLLLLGLGALAALAWFGPARMSAETLVFVIVTVAAPPIAAGLLFLLHYAKAHETQ